VFRLWQTQGYYIYRYIYTHTVIPQFTSLISSSKTARKAKTCKTKINFREEVPGTIIGLREEGAHLSEDWLVNWKTGINLCISYEQKLINSLRVYRGITVCTQMRIELEMCFCRNVRMLLQYHLKFLFWNICTFSAEKHGKFSLKFAVSCHC
jgi:hypothetical protein